MSLYSRFQAWRSRNDVAIEQRALSPAQRMVNHFHMDGFIDRNTGLGCDPSEFAARQHRSYYQADTVYSFSRIMARIVDTAPNTCFAKGFSVNEISGDDITALESYLTGLDAFRKMADAFRWARLYGGSIVYMTINDGRSSEMPVDINRIDGISQITVFDSTECSVIRIGNAFGTEYFGEPELYQISTDGKYFTAHASRVLHFDGVPISRSARKRHCINNGFSASVVDQVWDSFSAYLKTNGYFSETIKKLTQGVLKLTDLNKSVAGGLVQTIMNRLRTIIQSMSTIGDIVIDKDGEDYSVTNRQVTGFADAAGVFVDWLVAESDMPRSILMGQTSGGMADGNNDGDWKAWAGTCGAMQTIRLDPIAAKLLRYVFACRMCPIADPPNRFTVLWPPILQMSERENAEIYAMRAPGRASDIASGCVSPIEARASDDVIATYHLDSSQDQLAMPATSPEYVSNG